MLIYEYKVRGNTAHYVAIDEAIRTTQFIRNKCLRLWMDTRVINLFSLHSYCAELAKQYRFAKALNSQARQVASERAWFAISRFYENCKQHTPGKKGYPRFQHDNRSVEYTQSGWKLEPEGKHVIFTDGCGIGRLRLVGNPGQRIGHFPVQEIKRVRLVRRADGYYCQFSLDARRKVKHTPTSKQIGIDVGLKAYTTDSDGNTVANPRFYRQSEKKLKRLHRHHSRTQKKSSNRKKAQRQLAKGYLKVQRQREDFARKQANALVSSRDVIAFEDLKIRNMVKNKHLSKSIHDAGWGIFLNWVKIYGAMHDIPIIAVAPHFTSQDCSGCHTRVKKSLSVRTHICPSCGLVLDRDENAARNILEKAVGTVGHTGTGTRTSANASGQKTATRRSVRATSTSSG